MRRASLVVVLSVAAVIASRPAAIATAAPDVTFTRDVAPILHARMRHLPSARRSGADGAAHVSGRAAVGAGDQGQGRRAPDAAVVRRSRGRDRSRTIRA